MVLRAVIFDVSGTLLGYEPSVLLTRISRILQGHLPSPQSAMWRFGRLWAQRAPESDDDAEHFWERFACQFAEDAELPPELVPDLTRELRRFSDGYFAFPDAKGVVEQLQSRHLKTAILTNHGMPDLSTALNRCGVDADSFSAIVSCRSLQFSKPDRRAYSYVAEQLHLDISDCGFVDDTPAHVLAARDAGMHAWLIDRDQRHTSFPGMRLDSLAEVAGAVGPLPSDHAMTRRR